MQVKKIYLLFLMLFIMLSCNNQLPKETEKANGIISKDASKIYRHKDGFSPLTYSKYNNIISNNDQFTDLDFTYARYLDPDPDGRPTKVDIFHLRAGDSLERCYFNSINEFDGELNIWDNNIPTKESYEKTFTVNDFNSILTYLNNHNDYFFNGYEYEGLGTPPILVGNLRFTTKKYNIALAFYDPSMLSPGGYHGYSPCWAFSKSSDHPEIPDDPDHILQGLIDIIETNFISQFEP